MSNMCHTLYIGANFVSHDSSVFGLCNGKLFAISEERFTRFKHDAIWPIHALGALRNYLKNEGANFEQIICVVPMKSAKNVYTHDSLQYHRFMRKMIGGRYIKDYVMREAELKTAKDFISRFGGELLKGTISVGESFTCLLKRCFIKRSLEDWVSDYLREIFSDVPVEVRFYDHHECHALSAFVMSEFNESLVITMDGWGDGAFTKVYRADRKGIALLSESVSYKADTSSYDLPKEVCRTGIFTELSVGHAYSIITWLLGFTPTADEGKVEALAAYAEPDEELLARFLSTVRVDDGKIVIQSDRFIEVFHQRASHDQMQSMPREVVSASIQCFLEDVYLRLVSFVSKKHGIRRVCLAGGVAANVILNMKIFRNLGLELFVVPAMADDGTAMGAAFLAAHEQEQEYDFSTLNAVTTGMPYYGTSYTAEETLAVLESDHGLPLQWSWLGNEWPIYCAQRICEHQEIGALFHGRCEYGPRALGNRSIVADLRNAENTKRINLLVKSRPGFQPFCPSFLVEERERLFDNAYINKHMTCAFLMKKEHVDKLPCAVHVDNTARVQFVTETSNPSFYSMLCEIKRLSGYGGLLNTSFNKHGRTICESPLDALTDFIDCNIDFLFINGYLVTRSDMA